MSPLRSRCTTVRFKISVVNGGALAREIVKWKLDIAENWSKVNFGRVDVETLGDFHQFRIQVYLGELPPDAVLVELYADSQYGDPAFRQPMHRATPS